VTAQIVHQKWTWDSGRKRGGQLWEREAEREKAAGLETFAGWLVTDFDPGNGYDSPPEAFPIRDLTNYPSRTGLCGIRGCVFKPHPERPNDHTWSKP
jgi:hypothetical protein